MEPLPDPDPVLGLIPPGSVPRAGEEGGGGNTVGRVGWAYVSEITQKTWDIVKKQYF